MRVDTNESILVQKAIAIKALRIAMKEKDSEIRSLRKKVSAIVYQAGLSPSVFCGSLLCFTTIGICEGCWFNP